jgi:hypothetical protein
MGGKEGADRGPGVEDGEGLGRESVAMCGNSLSGKNVRDSPPPAGLIRGGEPFGACIGPKEGGKVSKPCCCSEIEFLCGRGCVVTLGELEGSRSNVGSSLSLSLSSPRGGLIVGRLGLDC